MNYSRAEMETSIVWDEEEKLAKIYTASPVMIRKLNKLCAECSAYYRRTWIEKDKDGRITAAKYETTCKLIRFGKPREVTEEQREIARERISRYWSERKSN